MASHRVFGPIQITTRSALEQLMEYNSTDPLPMLMVTKS